MTTSATLSVNDSDSKKVDHFIITERLKNKMNKLVEDER